MGDQCDEDADGDGIKNVEVAPRLSCPFQLLCSIPPVLFSLASPIILPLDIALRVPELQIREV